MLLVSAAHLLGTQFLADGGDSPSDVDSTTGHGPEWGEAAPIGLLVIVLMCVGVYFLVKSLNRNLKKVPESFDEVPVSVGANAMNTAGSVGSVHTVNTVGLGSDTAEPTGAAADSVGDAGPPTADPGPASSSP